MPIAPEATEVQASRGKIVEALVRMGRAVQKAHIYPEGHPAVPGAVDLFLAAFGAALDDKTTLSLGIAVDRFLVDSEPLEEKHGVLPWFAAHLHERGLASIDIESTLGEEVMVRFVRWLAKPVGTAEPLEDETMFEGIVLKKFDYSRASFAEDPTEEASVEHDSVRAWQAMMSGMTAGMMLERSSWELGDPTSAAREVSEVVHHGGEVDAKSVASRVIAMGVNLPGLPDRVRGAVKRRLGSFIGALTPELRAQLLRVDARSSRQKLEFISEMLDSLPKSTVVEVLDSLSSSGGHVPHQFITLMNKLIGVSARDRTMQDGVGLKLASMGIPSAVMDVEPDKAREVLSEVMKSRIELSWNPELYQALLEDLSSRTVEGGETVTTDSYGDPCSREVVTAHVSEIALRLLVARPESPEAPGYVRRLGDDAPRAYDSGRFGQLHEARNTLNELVKGQWNLSPELEKELAAYFAQFTMEERIEKLLAAAEAGPTPIPPPIAGLFLVAGADAACAAFRRLAAASEGPARERLTELLVTCEAEALAAAVGRIRNEGWALLKSVFPILHRIGGTVGIELALTFVGNEDERVRVEAIRLLIALDDRPDQHAKYLEKALSDDSARVVTFAINQARQHPGADSTYLLGAFLRSEKAGAQEHDSRAAAIAALASFRTVPARDLLISLLSKRRVSFSVKEERVSSALEEALLLIGDEAAMKAVKAWRHSLSRWLTVLLVRGKVKDQ